MVLPAAVQHSQAREAPSYQQDVAQPTQQDHLRTEATNLNAQRTDLFRKKDLNGVAALYTADATYVELLPRLQVMMGRSQIQQHMSELITSKATDLVVTVTSAEMKGSGEMMVGGDYFLVVTGGKKISGHFFQVLRKEGGAWKIAMHAFARPEPVTPVEANEYNVRG